MSIEPNALDMPRVLIVSPHFPPTNAADMQRVRLLLPYLKSAGWDAEVIAASPECVAAPQDDWLNESIPIDVAVHRVRGLSLAWSRIPGLGQLYPRIRFSLGNRGAVLLQSKRFDLVYFSTTQFSVHTLGPKWKKKYGIPFCMDYQDPWVSEYYDQQPDVVPPGGRFKYRIAQSIARRQEPWVLKHCSGITSVSPAYPEQLRQRYPFLPPNWPVLLAPFPGDRRDIERVAIDPSIRQKIFNPMDGNMHWVYVGRGGFDLHCALRGLFWALKNLKDTNRLTGEQSYRSHDLDWQKLKLHFVGTSYAASGHGIKTVEPLAAEFGLGNMVVEHTDRIPYSQTLRCLLDAHALIVPGSDDPGYTASKIYPYLLARKPLLTIFHEKSSVNELIRNVSGAISIQFNLEDSPQSLGQRIKKTWLDLQSYQKALPLDDIAFTLYTASKQASLLTSFFRTVLDQSREFFKQNA